MILKDGRLEGQLEALVCAAEPEPFVEAVGINTRLVAGELDERTTTTTGILDRPAHHRATETSRTMRLVHPDRLDLHPQRAATGEPGKHRQLHRADDRAVHVGGDEQLLCLV